MADEEIMKCPECGNLRKDFSTVCPMCGAAPIKPGEHRAAEEEVRTEDLEPYVTLRYIALLFKVLAVIQILVMILEVITGFKVDAGAALWTLIPEVTRMLVLAAVMWAAGDIMMLLIDLGHDIRVSRILLGRVNAELHRRGGDTK